jgi:DNA adenine methylase
MITSGALPSPIWWPGGKSTILTFILSNLPPHKTYAEPFGGGGVVLLNKTKAKLEVYADIDARLVALFTALARENTAGQLISTLALLPYGRRTYFAANTVQHNSAAFIAGQRMSFGGKGNSGYGFAVTEETNGQDACTSRYAKSIEKVSRITKRIERVVFEHADCFSIFTKYDTPETLFYLDPPYLTEERTGDVYLHEMTSQDHQKLVDTIMQLSGMVVISGYANVIYETLEANGWLLREHKTTCSLAGRVSRSTLKGAGSMLSQQQRTECVWINPAAQAALKKWH